MGGSGGGGGVGGSISHRWRKWGNLGPGVREVMDFNAQILVNGSLN